MKTHEFHTGLLADRCVEINLWEELRGVAIRRTDRCFQVISYDDPRHSDPCVTVHKRFPLTHDGLAGAVDYANSRTTMWWCDSGLDDWIAEKPFTEAECLKADRMPRPRRTAITRAD